MPMLCKESLGGGRENRLLIAIYGAGPTSAGYPNRGLRLTTQAMGLATEKPFNHGADDEIYEYIEENANGKNVVIIGYSMGGACAIRVANNLCRDSIKVDTLVTIDPVPLSASMKPRTILLSSTRAGLDIDKVYNFYQQSYKQTGRLGGRWINGDNPYFGSRLAVPSGSTTELKQKFLRPKPYHTKLDQQGVPTHLNIIEMVLGKT